MVILHYYLIFLVKYEYFSTLIQEFYKTTFKKIKTSKHRYLILLYHIYIYVSQ